MEQINLKAVIRQEKGKQQVKHLRDSGWVPGVVYHRGEKTIEVAVDTKELSKIMRAHSGENVLINMTLEKDKKKSRAVIIKELQRHPVQRSILHVDFNEISLTEKIAVEVEVMTVGEAIGVKQEGGVLDRPLRHVKVQCLPTDIPKHLDVDISALKLNGVIHVKDMVLPSTIKVLTDPEAVLCLIKLPVEEKAPEADAVAPEVEVLREKKEEEAKPGEKAEKSKEDAKASEKK